MVSSPVSVTTRMSCSREPPAPGWPSGARGVGVGVSGARGVVARDHGKGVERQDIAAAQGAGGRTFPRTAESVGFEPAMPGAAIYTNAGFNDLSVGPKPGWFQANCVIVLAVLEVTPCAS